MARWGTAGGFSAGIATRRAAMEETAAMAGQAAPAGAAVMAAMGARLQSALCKARWHQPLRARASYSKIRAAGRDRADLEDREVLAARAGTRGMERPVTMPKTGTTERRRSLDRRVQRDRAPAAM